MAAVVTLFGSFAYINCCLADSLFAPTWFKEGIYAEYKFEDIEVLVSDGSIKAQNAIFRWECTNYNGSTAKLNITLSGTQTERFYGDFPAKIVNDVVPLFMSAQVYVDPASRAVYCVNGTHIGTTHLWLPANPADGENITIWNMPANKVTLPARVGGTTTTPQGFQKTFIVGRLYHDLDTGLMTLTRGITGFSDVKEPAIDALKIDLLAGTGNFAATNIDLGPKDEPFNWQALFAFIALPSAFAITFIGVYWKRRKTKSNRNRIHQLACPYPTKLTVDHLS
ncbi:MAG: hypothetical protein NWF05_01605 [Candidatus Bathyarchaeota archaeon]|nr:hypothetical protein [Candidatus Bathyarchaeota archaeon]